MAETTPAGYTPLGEASLPAWLAGLPAVADRLGGGPSDWQVREVGDGNLNLVFLVDGPAGRCCVKQALPYVRLVGPEWPLPLERTFFEHECLRDHGAHAARLVPEVWHYDPAMFAIVMEQLAPHVIMRRGMIDGVVYPRFADDIAEYCATTLFYCSDLYLTAAEKKARMAVFCGNTELCKITEDLIFTDPYRTHELNRWTSPQLDEAKATFERDDELKLAVSRLKVRFMGSAEALIHGDLHTGSIMVTPEDTRVIDPEFAFWGPRGFDLGAVVGNLLLNYLAQDGHEAAGRPSAAPRDAYRRWVLETIERFWTGFDARFLALWRTEARGDAYPQALFADPAGQAALERERERFVAELWRDTLGFGAAKMIRRILGLAHNIDLEWIEDPDMRARCERRCLALARTMMTEPERYPTVADLLAAAGAARAP
jgi:5-methylthioribose kinase